MQAWDDVGLGLNFIRRCLRHPKVRKEIRQEVGGAEDLEELKQNYKELGEEAEKLWFNPVFDLELPWVPKFNRL